MEALSEVKARAGPSMFGRTHARRRVDTIGPTRLLEAQSDAQPKQVRDILTSRSQRAVEGVRSHVKPGSFPLLLVTTLLVYVLNGLAVDSIANEIVVRVGRVGV